MKDFAFQCLLMAGFVVTVAILSSLLNAPYAEIGVNIIAAHLIIKHARLPSEDGK